MSRTSQPVIKVTLIKTIRRRNNQSERYDGLAKSLDLTPLLDDNSSVIVRKSINEQAGRFSVTLADKLIQPEPGAFQDSLYGWVEPMDVIEIRMGRDLHTKGRTADDIPIVMRGFVRDIIRDQSVSNAGQPIRTITLSGYDYGYLLGVLQIFYEKTYSLGKDLLTALKMTTNEDIRFQGYTTSTFVNAVIDKVVNPRLESLQKASALNFTPRIIPDATVSGGYVAPYGFQSFEGSLWDLLRTWTDRYWNELFIEDREDGVYLVCRQMPFKNINGDFIGNAKEPGTSPVAYEHVKSFNIRRSDQNVINYFWVSAPRSLLVGESMLKMQAYATNDEASQFFLKDYPNTKIDLYGYRKLEVRTEQGEAVPGLSEEQLDEAITKHDTWIQQRVRLLREFNKDNVIFEEGRATVRGDDAIKAGRYLRMRMGSQQSGYTAEYYCTGLTHEYLPYRSWLTKVELIRGNGFIERSKLAGSPYLAERGKGAYE